MFESLDVMYVHDKGYQIALSRGLRSTFESNPKLKYTSNCQQRASRAVLGLELTRRSLANVTELEACHINIGFQSVTTMGALNTEFLYANQGR